MEPRVFEKLDIIVLGGVGILAQSLTINPSIFANAWIMGLCHLLRTW